MGPSFAGCCGTLSAGCSVVGSTSHFPCVFTALFLLWSLWQRRGQLAPAHFQEVGTEAQGSAGSGRGGGSIPDLPPCPWESWRDQCSQSGSRSSQQPLREDGVLQGRPRAGTHPGRCGFPASAPTPAQPVSPQGAGFRDIIILVPPPPPAPTWPWTQRVLAGP